MAHNHAHDHSDTGNLRVAFFLNLAFTIVEIFGGLYTNSVAILSDALHDLGDSFSLGLAWYLGKYSEKERDEFFSYGYRRYSLVGALTTTIVLVVGSIFVLIEALPRLAAPEQPDARGMIVFALIGVAVNGFAALRVREGHSLNSRAVALHLLEDVLGWAAVLVVSIVLLFFEIPILDPLLSIAITLFVLFNVFKNLRRTVRLFLQAVPEEVDMDDVERRLAAIDGVNSVHHTHIWSLDGEHHVLTTHLVVPADATRDDVLAVKRQTKTITNSAYFEHVTVEIEYEGEDCSMAPDPHDADHDHNDSYSH